MKLLSRILNGSPAHPPLAEWQPLDYEVAETGLLPLLDNPRPIHWLETATKFGTPIGTIACDALACDDTVVTVRLDDVTCRKCRDAIDASVIAPVQAEPELAVPSCTATTSKGARCKFRAEPGSDRCAMPAHSHQRQP